MIVTIFAGIVEVERDLIRERTGAGRADARRSLRTAEKDEQRELKLALRLLKEGTSVAEVAKTFSIHTANLYRVLTPAA